ncbi:MAG: sugar transferase [Ferruginibacter sp.]|nr:sugar transferase [Ferruginibacter sp.]
MYRFCKRVFDLFIAILALIILSPIWLIAIVLLSLTGEREIFYLQKRIGHKSKPFFIWKFATMLKNSPNMGTGEITLRKDPRVTSVGNFLRKTKINELPQLVNVFKGEMSIVGPRPLMEVSFNLYTPEVGNRIYLSLPGITGIGSIIFRDEEIIVSRSSNHRETYNKIFDYKSRVELWYQDNASFYVDIMIVFLTAWTIIFPKNNLTFKVFKTLPKRPEFFSE